MFSSLKKWMDVPITVLPFEKVDGTGYKTFGEGKAIMSYPHSEIKVIQNFDGEEVTSNTQLYIDGSEDIGRFDKVIFNEEEFVIHSIGVYFRKGVPDIKVVYV